MTLARRTALAAFALLILVLPGRADAHAVLEQTDPGRGAALEQVPAEVTFRFNEPVEVSFGSVEVYDRDGEEVSSGETFRPGERSDSVGVALEPGLGDGVYTATYRVVSGDSHPVSGGFTFTVGDAGQAASVGVADLVDEADSGAAADVALGVAKVVTYLATAVLFGGVAFLALVWGVARPPAASAAFEARLRRLFAGAIALGAVASVVGIVAQGAIATGGSLADGLRPAVIGDVLETRFGTAWGLRLADFALLAALLRVPLPRNGLAVTALGLALGFLTVVPALAGHPGVTDPRAVSLAASVVHVGAFATWAGGLVVLLAAVPAATRAIAGAEKTALLASVVGRFSAVALSAVAALLATGIVQAVLQLEAWSELVDTGYGRAILVKAALLACLIVLGGVNRQRIRPRLDRLAAAGAEASGPAGVALRRTLRAEVALVFAVLVATAVLTALSPAARESAGPFSDSATLGPAELELTVDPAAVGANQIHLYLFDRESGAQYREVKEFQVTASLPESGIGPLDLDALKSGPGHYVVRDAQFAPGGDWRLDVSLRISAFDEYATEVEVPIR